MSRSGYIENLDNWALIKWRGQVASASRGRRGQKFFRDLVAALDALPEKRLVEGALEEDGDVCALGAVARFRGLDLSKVDPEEDAEYIAPHFDIAHQLAQETTFTNDEASYSIESPEQRWHRVRAWAVGQIRPQATPVEAPSP